MISPAQKSTSLKKKIVAQYLEDVHENLYRSHPIVPQWLNAAGLSVDDLRFSSADAPSYSEAEKTVSAKLSSQLNSDKDAPLLHTITQEEERAIIFKLREIVNLHSTNIEKKDLFYLEQQLSDLLGFEVSSELEGKKLPFVIGTMAAGRHLKRHPADTIEHHHSYLEAGLSKSRSAFGWMLSEAALSKQSAEAEKYGVSLPLNYLPEWQSDRTSTKNWFKHHKLLIVNPFELKAVVASITDVGPTNTMKYQFEGSPEIIRSALIWSPNSQGKVLVFFVNDPQDKVSHGPIILSP